MSWPQENYESSITDHEDGERRANRVSEDYLVDLAADLDAADRAQAGELHVHVFATYDPTDGLLRCVDCGETKAI